MRGLRAALQEEDPDILHLHGAWSLLTMQALLAARRLKLPAVVDSHICYVHITPMTLRRRLYYQAYRRVLLPLLKAPIARYLPNSPGAADVLRNEFGVRDSEMTHTTLGTDADAFRFNADARKRCRDVHGIPRDARVLVFAGRLDPAKGLEVLIRAAAPLLETFDAWLLLAGPVDDGYRDALQQLIPRHLRARVAFAGAVPHDALVDYYCAADVSVWPGDPAISIIDAMACGLPLVIGRSGCVSHFVANSNGLGFARGDSEDLRRKLEAVLGDEAARRAMGQASRELVDRVFDWKRVAARTNDIYREVLDGNVRRLGPLWT